MKTSSFFRIFRSAALVLGFVFGLFFAGQARANYIDGGNLYGGYFAGRVGMDPDGDMSLNIDSHGLTFGEVAKIQNGFSAMGNRTHDLITQVNGVLSKMPKCMSGTKFETEFKGLNDVLKKMDTFSSSDQTVKILHSNLGHNGTLAQSNEIIGWGLTSIELNDQSTDPNWKKMSQDVFNERIAFHEFSHYAGDTLDDDSKGALINAHTIERLMNHDISGWDAMIRLLNCKEFKDAGCCKQTLADYYTNVLGVDIITGSSSDPHSRLGCFD